MFISLTPLCVHFNPCHYVEFNIKNKNKKANFLANFRHKTQDPMYYKNINDLSKT